MVMAVLRASVRPSPRGHGRNRLYPYAEREGDRICLKLLASHGMDDERSSIAFTIANGGMTAGLQVSIFLTSSAVDLVRKDAIDGLVVHPLEPLAHW
jgi:hypothetical protein